MSEHFDRVIASYHRARSNPQFFDKFYELFFRKSPEIPRFFVRTDFRHQKRMLQESLLEMLVYYQTGGGRDQIERLAERHRQLHVKSEHYAFWMDALLEALGQFDPEFGSELDVAWRAAMQSGLDIMLSSQTDVSV